MDYSEFFSQAYVIWFLVGLALFLLEFAIPGLVVMFFGFGAWITAILLLIFDMGITLQVVIFLSTSTISLILLRKYFKTTFIGKSDALGMDEAEEFIGKKVEVFQEIVPGRKGKVIFKGAQWSAIAEDKIEAGEMAEIYGKDSITLKVKKS